MTKSKNYFTTKAFKAFVVFGLSICTLNSISQTADAGLDQTICEGASVTIGGAPTASGGLPPYTYSWVPAVGLSSATVANPVASPTSTTTYTVTITDANATSTSDVVTVTVNPAPASITANSNTPVCDGSQLFLSGSVAGGVTFNWTGPNGFSATTQNPQINPVSLAAAGTYTFTAVSAQGCASSASTVVVVSALPTVTITGITDVTCNGLSNGSATATASGGVPPYSYSWSPSGASSQVVTNFLAAGSHTVVATDINGCSSQTNAIINEPTAVTMNVFSPTACLGDSATITPIVNGGTPPYSYVWDQGGTYYYTPTLTLAPASSVTFTLNVTDANGCYTYDYPGITVSPLTDMYGTIDYSGGALVNGGTAVLFNWYASSMAFDTAQTTTVSAAGTYLFSSVSSGNYLIKVFPDTLLYPTTVPTYFGDQYIWTLAQVKNHGCVSNDTANIFMVEGVAGVGPGMLQGTVLEGPGFSRLEGDPIPGIDIKLGRNPGGALVASTTTNASGQFTFDNVDINNIGEYYTVYVDLPGRDRDSTYNVTVTATNTTFNQLDHAVDSNSVYPIHPVTTTISNIDLANENQFVVYPNPFNTSTTVAYTLYNSSSVKLEVYNVLGEKVQTVVNGTQAAAEFKYNLNNLNPGVYFVSLTINGKNSTQRIIKMD
ncbi:MAG: T9SS type A sorting domain-containing protein [Bacteroidetes bacterium]|nr:T9SS type A sorting domain-containing protein [Bacteroidota bacterium]